MSRFISYASNFEDVLLWRALGQIENGFYVDVGAVDPVDHSVTKVFYDAGWHGINVGPSPVAHRALAQHRPRDVNLAVAFEVEAAVTTLACICREHVHADIHFLNVDVEGNEREVLGGMEFTRWRPWVVVVRAARPGRPDATHEAWEEPVTRSGYRFALFDGVNRFYVADEHPELLPAFVAPPNVLDDFVPLALHEARLTVQSLNGELESLRVRTAMALESAGATSARADDLALQVEALRQSRSWRYTAPCRLAGELVRTVASKLAPILGLRAALSSTLPRERAFEDLPASERRIAEDLRRCLPVAADDWRVVPMPRETFSRSELERAAQATFDAVENLARHSARGRCLELVREIARHAGPASGSLPELAAVASAIAAKLPPGSPCRLLVDVSSMVHTDDRTGIQRVVRGVLGALLAEPPAGYRVEPVASPGQGRAYRHARRFTLEMLGERELTLPEEPADRRPGDLFLGLDLCQDGTAQNGLLLQSMHDRGVRIYFVVYDILPVLRPGSFPPGAESSFGCYLRTVASVADGLICISRAVADELYQWLIDSRIPRVTPLAIGYFHLGAEFPAAASATRVGRDGNQLLDAARARPSFLMVGTVEPRKGHGQALDAFEQLWKAGHELNLVIAGKQGWMMQPLADRIRSHPRLGERLFWAREASDDLLVELYGAATALLAASEGEGFGLPLIEAARHGLPIIARDLPVFREVAGEHAHYFRGLTARDLAASLEQWLALRREGKAPDSGGIRRLTWSQSARQLLDAIEHQRWYKQVPLPGR